MRATLTIIFLIVTRTVSQLCNYEDSVELNHRAYNGINYEVGEFFVDNTTGVERGCVCMKEFCARKCCPLGQGYDAVKKSCVDLPEMFSPPVFERSIVKQWFNTSSGFHLLFFKMNCSKESNEFRIAVRSATRDYRLKTDGKLYVTMEDNIPSNLVYGPDKYCVDNFVTENTDTKTKSIEFNGLICFVATEENYFNYALNASCMLISCFFFILTVAVYSFLPELRTLHGMVMTACLMSFFVAFLFLATMQICLLVDTITQSWCVGMTFVIYYASLAAFFWLNVMSYDLWAKLRTVNVARGFTKSKLNRFLFYCTYAFGVPALLTILLAALEFSDLPADTKLLPHLRRKGCFIYGMSKLVYLYTPIMLLCVVNLILFTLTAIRIAKIKKQTQVLQRKDTQRFSLYVKLFVVTGINWILEVLSSLFPKIEYLWQFTDAYNVLFGLIIFIIFVCKKKIFNLLKERYNRLMDLPLSRKASITTTSSSLSKEESFQMKSKIEMTAELEMV